jgi:hypothetical protein
MKTLNKKSEYNFINTKIKAKDLGGDVTITELRDGPFGIVVIIKSKKGFTDELSGDIFGYVLPVNLKELTDVEESKEVKEFLKKYS